MDGFAGPPPTPKRKPGPRLAIIPTGASPYASGPSSSSSGDDAESSGRSPSNNSYTHSRHQQQQPSSSSSSKPKLSLFGGSRSKDQAHNASSSSSGSSSRDDVTVAPGFENMSLEDKTMTPYVMQQQYQQQQQQQLQSQSQSKPSSLLGGLKTKPKLALGSMARTPSPHLNAASSSSAAISEGMSRSTSFEGALIAETSHVNVDGDDYKLCAETLQDLGRLGEGASGEVRKVLHKPSGLIMAKKTIPASPNEDVQKQILRELAFNRECRADFITRYYGAFLEDSDSQIAIMMEYCEGGSLDAIYRRIKQRQGRTGEKVLGKVAEAVLHGLVYLHDRKIIHRDIKPSNILVTRKGQFQLCDFGISGELINSMAGTFCGTSYYMAPERIRGSRYTITADIWSLGLTIHEVAMNRFPFPPEGEPPLGPIELLTYIVKMDTPALADSPEEGIKWTKSIQDFLRQCLEKDPTKRPGPKELLQHPWILKSENWKPNLEAWVASVWEW